MMTPVRIIHETNPLKYFVAVFRLEEEGRLKIVGSHRYSLVKESIRSLLRERKTIRQRARNLRADIGLRLRLPFIKDETIILAIAPWDWRLLLYRHLSRHNRIIYHTSWPNWHYSRVPRRYPLVGHAYRMLWYRFLRQPNVYPVAVQRQAAEELFNRVGVQATVIPHSVVSEFFQISRNPRENLDRGLRLIFIGELSEKKGLKEIIRIAKDTVEFGVWLTVVGDGPLRGECLSADRFLDNVKFLGSVSRREELAQIMSKHDVLILLSKRTASWQELFGIVIIEALAAGLGVIATDHIGPKSIFDGYDCGNLFRENDVEGIQNLVKELAKNSSQRVKFLDRQRGIADRYHIDCVAEDWARILSV